MKLSLCVLFICAPLVSGFPAVRYVDANNPTPSAPYSSWSTAAVTIQDAVDVAVAGDEVLVTNGLYATGGRAVYGTMTNRVVVDKGLYVHSVNGARFTIIQGRQSPGTSNGADAIRCIYLTSGASLSGFTLTNGATHDTGATYLEQSGGGIWCDAATVAVSNCILTGNSASYTGGGVYYGSLYNCAIFLNAAGSAGGGAEVSSLYNCTVAGNTAGVSYGGTAFCNLYNSIVYFNSPDNGNFCCYNTINYSCTTPMASYGVGNISSDPKLASLTHLSLVSPCRGAGSSSYSAGVELDGETWLSPPSMGCDEYHPGAVTGPLSAAIIPDLTNVPTNYGVRLVALIDGRTTGSRWDFGDGSQATNQPVVNHSWASLGDYQVTLTAVNESNPDGISATVIFHVIEPAVYYVAAWNPNPSRPYTSWATAATNIQDAIDAAMPEAVVLVTNGWYASGGRVTWDQFSSTSNRVVLSKNLSVRSVNGPGFTIVSGGGVMNCAYLSNGTSLSGFTLTNGTYGVSAPQATNAAVSNCVMVGNSYQGAIGYEATPGYSVPGLTIRKSIIKSNASGGASYATLNNCSVIGNNGTGAWYCNANNCLLAGNSASSGGGAYLGTLNNCTIVSNSASYAGGGIWSTNGAINNCIIYYNTAASGSNWAGSGFRAGPAPQSYCCTVPDSGGVGCITNEPLFIDWPGGNFRLQSNSPCINAGNNSYVAGSTDLDGNPRIINGTVDMGAYEFGASPPSLKIMISGGNVALSWPLWASNYSLFESSDFSSDWSNSAASPVMTNGENSAFVPVTEKAKFYRLYKP